MSLEVQKWRVIDLQSQLDLLVNRVEILKGEFNVQLDRALANGLPVETYQIYKAYYLSRLYNGLDNITTRIMHDDMGYLNDVRIVIQKAIDSK